MRILAVDDDPIFLEILSRMLSQYGEQDVVRVESGADALNAIRTAKSRFDLFLFDILMPEMDGIELVKQVRQIRGCEATPIMMLTKVAQRDYVTRAFQAGATDYLTKPLDPLEFHGRINVMKRLNLENRKRLELLRSVRQGAAPVSRLPFEEPLTVSSVDCMIDFPTLCGYISALGAVDRLGVSVMAVKVENMASIYARSNTETLVDVVGMIASTLFAGIRPRLAMMSYLGSGDFVCVLNGRTIINAADLRSSIDLAQSGVRDAFTSKALPMPNYRIGRQFSMGIFANRNITQIVTAAINSVRSETGGHSPMLRMSA